jgi:hypothetical protein
MPAGNKGRNGRPGGPRPPATPQPVAARPGANGVVPGNADATASARIQRLEAEVAKAKEDAELAHLLYEEADRQKAALEAQIQANAAELTLAYQEAIEAEIRARSEQAARDAAAVKAQASAEAAETVHRAREEAANIIAAAEDIAARTNEAAQTTSAQLAEKQRQQRGELEAERSQVLLAAHAQAEAQTARLAEELARQLADVGAREKAIRKVERELEIREDDLNLALTSVRETRARAEILWRTCSPDRVQDLEREVDLLNRYREQDAKTIRVLQSRNAELQGLMVATDGRALEAIIQEGEDAQARARRLADQLSVYPALEEINALRFEASEARQLREANEVLHAQLREATARAGRLELGTRELAQITGQADALRVLNNELRRNLDEQRAALEGQAGERFPELVLLDKAPPRTPQAAQRTNTAPLKALVDHVRKYAATRDIPLYYAPVTIRAFLAGLAASRFVILQGLSGTGKTSLPDVFFAAIDGQRETISVQSSWRDRHELLGYNNEFSKRFNETEFTKAVYEAGRDEHRDIPWAIVLDEMNLARVEYYFADFLSALERPREEERTVALTNMRTLPGTGPRWLINGHRLRVPRNLWFIGTANQDESTLEITDKVYDRAQVLDFRRREEAFAAEHAQPLTVSWTLLQKEFATASGNSKYQMSEEDWEYIHRLERVLQDHFGITFGNRVQRQLQTFVPVFVAAGGKKYEAIDYQLARKVLRKVEALHGHTVQQGLQQLRKVIDEEKPTSWGRMESSQEMIDRKIRQLGGTPG